jgi:hypothetical protein
MEARAHMNLSRWGAYNNREKSDRRSRFAAKAAAGKCHPPGTPSSTVIRNSYGRKRIFSTTGQRQSAVSARPSDLAVIRARGLGWTDLGEPRRVSSMLRHKSEAANREG